MNSQLGAFGTYILLFLHNESLRDGKFAFGRRVGPETCVLVRMNGIFFVATLVVSNFGPGVAIFNHRVPCFNICVFDTRILWQLSKFPCARVPCAYLRLLYAKIVCETALFNMALGENIYSREDILQIRP